MTEHFNKLTPAQAERLAMLIEEAGEVITAATKILRHGYESYHPERPATGEGSSNNNRHDLERELGDLLALRRHMVMCGDISDNQINFYLNNKMGKAKKYMHHFREDL